jgi:hypothetical protein
MKGSNTAEVIRLVAMACCVRLVGSGARAENCRTAECLKPDLMTVVRAILKELEDRSCASSRILQIMGGLDSFMSQSWFTADDIWSFVDWWDSLVQLFQPVEGCKQITKAERC